MRTILKSKKGISPILATLLLIVIAVAAVIVTYAWVMTFTGSTTSQAGAILKLDNVRFYTQGGDDRIDIVVRNTGTADATIDLVYAGDSASNLVIETDLRFRDSDGVNTQVVAAGSTLTITFMDYPWDEGETYYFNIATEEGYSLPFPAEA
jgi:flagellin-like protein